MATNDPEWSPEQREVGAAKGSRAALGQGRGVVLFRALLAGVLAALLTWAADEAGLLRVAAQLRAVNTMGTIVNTETTETRAAALLRTCARTYGFLGAITALALAIVGGRKDGRLRMVIAAAAGMSLAALAAAGPPFVVIPLYDRAVGGAVEELIPSIVMHWGLWTLMGAAAGLAFGIARGGLRRVLAAALGGAIGSLLGTVVYDLIGAVVLPFSDTGQPLAATRLSHFLCFVLLAMSIAVGAALLGKGDDR